MVRLRLLVLFVFATGSAQAQIGGLQDGARVRVRTGAGEISAGTLLKSPGDSVFISGSTDASSPFVQKFALRNVTSVDVSVRKRGHVVEGLFIGAVAGTGIGLLIAAISGDDDSSINSLEEFGAGLGDAIADGIVVIACGLGGAIMGAIIGNGQKTDTWRPIDMTAQIPQLALRRMPGGRTGVGLSFAFGGAGQR